MNKYLSQEDKMLAPQVEPTSKLWSDIKYELDGGIGARAHIGIVSFSVDQTLSHEARAMLTIPGIALYESRILVEDEDQSLTIDLLEESFDGIDGAIRQINTWRPSDVVALGCTSAAVVIGPQELKRRVRKVHPHAHVTDPFTGIVSALRALGSARVGFVSPYPRDVAEETITGIEDAGVPVRMVGRFQNQSGFIRREAPFISPTSISTAVRQVINSVDVDTVVIACTQMRAAAIIDELEQETGKAIISSNQAMCWHALRLAECCDVVHGWGRLFETQLQ